MKKSETTRPLLGIVVPVLNDTAALVALIPQLRPLQERGARWVVVDGGSVESERLHAQDLIREAGGLWLSAPRGRALQMNAGAEALLSNQAVSALWFVHADSGLPRDADLLIHNALMHHAWGRFDVRIKGRSRCLPTVARMMNWRSRVTHISTGDQGLFMRRGTFERLAGFAPIALMEDVEMSRRLKRLGPPACLREQLVTSGRRWDDHGALRTIMLMWALRFRYWCGASPEALHRRYYRTQTDDLVQPQGTATPHSP